MKEMKIDDVKVEKEEKAQESTASERAAEKLKQAARELYKEHSDIEILRAELKDARQDLDSAYREIEELRKTISKMKYAHDEEVRALEDDLAESKILAKKRGEAVDELDECCVTFSKIRFMANTAVDMAASLRKMAHMIEEEAEEHC